MQSETELGRKLGCYRYSWLGRHRGVVISLRVIVFLVITAILVLLFDEDVEGGRNLSKIFGMAEFFLVFLVGGVCAEMMFGVVKLFNDVVARENGIEVISREGKRHCTKRGRDKRQHFSSTLKPLSPSSLPVFLFSHTQQID